MPGIGTNVLAVSDLQIDHDYQSYSSDGELDGHALSGRLLSVLASVLRNVSALSILFARSMPGIGTNVLAVSDL